MPTSAAVARAPAAVALAALLALAACRPVGEPAPPVPTRSTHAHDLLEAALDLDGRPVGALPPAARATVAVVFASWCGHCRDELPVLTALRERHPRVRVLGVNFRGHEEYEQRGDAAAVRAFVAELAPWLRVVPADERLWAALGRPARVPTLYVFDRGGALVRVFDRRREPMPTLAALEEALPP